MPFSESLKLSVKEKSNFQCCICETHYVEIHHITTQEDGGQDTEDNAAPLCPTCHDTYGANPQKRKFIREKRDYWYDVCKNKYSFNSLVEDITKKLEKTVTIDDLTNLEHNLKSNFKTQDASKPKQIKHYPSIEIKNFIAQKKYKDALKTINNNLEEFFYLNGTVHGELNQIEEMINAFNNTLAIGNTYSTKIDEYKFYHWAKYFNAGVNQFQLGTNSIKDDSSKMHYDQT